MGWAFVLTQVIRIEDRRDWNTRWDLESRIKNGMLTFSLTSKIILKDCQHLFQEHQTEKSLISSIHSTTAREVIWKSSSTVTKRKDGTD